MENKVTPKYVQATMNDEQQKAFNVYCAMNGITNKRQWLRELILTTIDYKGDMSIDAENNVE